MHDVRVVEATQHVDDGVALADISKELVSKTFALAGSLDESGDVHDFAGGGDDASGVTQLGQLIQSLIGDGNLSHLGVDGAKREVGCLRLRARQTIEERGFPHIGKAHDACFQCHSDFLQFGF